jgi:AhpD family alkylhydroperoxidase
MNNGHFNSTIHESGATPDFEDLLEWARLGAAHVRKNPACVEKHSASLRTRGETEERLHELNRWRQSPFFTDREKAALDLSESISLRHSKDLLQDALDGPRRHFDTSEMVRLSLALLAINDWIDLHAGPPIRVLVVEDNAFDEELLRRQLKKAGMADNVVFVPDAHQALELLSGPEGKLLRQDLIALFLDIHLPGMSGIELLRRLRAMPEMEDFPVIVMTSSQDPRDVEQCKKLKVKSYVEKPVTSVSFSKAVANLFHQAKV